VASTLKELEDRLVADPGRVLVITGAGVACASDPGNPSAFWTGLLRNGIERCNERCTNLPEGWSETTERLIKEGKSSLIHAATRIEEQLRGVHDGQFGSWLSDSVGQLRVQDNKVIMSLLSWETIIATLNYDGLIEEVSGLPPVTWEQSDLAIRVLRRESNGVLHLHGHYASPSSVVFSSHKYEDICRTPSAQIILRSIFALGTVVFVGCGGTTEDPNFRGLWDFCKEHLGSCQHSHFHLVRASEKALVEANYTGIPVRAISYGNEHSDLASFLAGIAEEVRQRRLVPDPSYILRRAQGDYDTSMAELESFRSGMSISVFVRRAFEISRSLWTAGGRRTAALAMDQVLVRFSEGLPTDERITYGLESAERLIEDGLNFHAVQRLESLSKDFATSSSGPVSGLSRFRILLARVMSQSAAINEALNAIETALTSASENERLRLEAERAELHLLDGNLDEALRVTVGVIK
jgi:hypothetical protein